MIQPSDLRNYFIFDGVPSTDFNLFINGNKTFSGATADLTLEPIPGRSGDMVRFNNRYNNVEVSYSSWIAEDMRIHLRSLRSFLLSRNGYRMLEDTYHPDEFRLAVFSGGLDVDASFENTFASFDIVFSCKPQRFLKSGEEQLTFVDSETTIYNPTYFDSKPMIRVYGNGTLTVGSKTLTVSNNENTYLDLDCEIMDAYTGYTNRNADIATSDNDFFTIPPGRINIEKTSGISLVTIKPRWFEM